MISSAETPIAGFPPLVLDRLVEARHLADSEVEASLGVSQQEGLCLMRKYRQKSSSIVSSEEALPRWAVGLVLLVRPGYNCGVVFV